MVIISILYINKVNFFIIFFNMYNMDLNQTIIKEFESLVKQIKTDYLNAQMDNNTEEMTMHKYRLQNIKKVLTTLKRIPFEITSIDQVKNIPGFGKGTLRRIAEILETGKLSELNLSTLMSDVNPKNQTIKQIQALTDIIGIGPKLAEKLVIIHKIKSITDLKSAISTGKISVSKDIILGLKYHNVFQRNIPRKEMTLIEKFLKAEIKKLDPNFNIMICGSYRRGKSTSGDIDVLLYGSEIKTLKQIKKPSILEKFVTELTTDGFLLDNLTYENFTTKYMGFSKLSDMPVRRIDIRLVPYESLHTAMLYFTGPSELNEEMRKLAKKFNLKLNEYGLYKINPDQTLTLLKSKSEADVFERLGMKYLTPEERESYATYKK